LPIDGELELETKETTHRSEQQAAGVDYARGKISKHCIYLV
jgi:hypothetical protein